MVPGTDTGTRERAARDLEPMLLADLDETEWAEELTPEEIETATAIYEIDLFVMENDDMYPLDSDLTPGDLVEALD